MESEMDVLEVLERMQVQNKIFEVINRRCKGDDAKAARTQLALTRWKFEKFPRATQTLGQCNSKTKTISINPVLMLPEHAKQFGNTVLHEVAHLLDWELYGKMDHSPRWKYLCVEIGGDGKTRSCFEGLKTVAKYNYICKDCGYVFEAGRRLKNESQRRHKNCVNQPHKGHLKVIHVKTGIELTYADKKQTSKVYRHEAA
jgi:predicted SprT family Zn-dependent metalloprotease